MLELGIRLLTNAVLRHPAGHYIAHFYDEEIGWYTANESVVVRKQNAGPHPEHTLGEALSVITMISLDS